METKATLAFIRIKLMNIKNKIQALNYYIEYFHKYINQKITALSSKGKFREDRIIYLFEAYDKVTDDEFKITLTQKRLEYHIGVKDITSEELMYYY